MFTAGNTNVMHSFETYLSDCDFYEKEACFISVLVRAFTFIGINRITDSVPLNILMSSIKILHG